MASYSSRPAMALKESVSYGATIEMEDGGKIELELWPDKAPEHVNSFVFLANDGFYDGVTFHRIISGFMAQGGDPTGTGTGGPGYNVPAEFNDTAHVEGVLSMARAQDPNSAGSQFFICNADATFLDRQYTAFGKVTSGMEVVHAFPDRDPQDPRQSRQPGPKMKSVTITES